jgi:hypothetical protein
MSKRNTIYVTGREYATLAYVAKHKKNGEVVLRVYPIQYLAKSRQPIPSDAYNKKDALATFHFENAEAVSTMVHFLSEMKDNAIYVEGQKKAYDDMAEQYNSSMESMSNELNRMENEFNKFVRNHPKEQAVKEPRVRTGVVRMGDLSDIPNEVLTELSRKVGEEQARRVKKPEAKEPATPVSQEQQ